MTFLSQNQSFATVVFLAKGESVTVLLKYDVALKSQRYILVYLV